MRPELRTGLDVTLCALGIACSATTPATQTDAGSSLPAVTLEAPPIVVVRGESTAIVVSAQGNFEGQNPTLAFASLPPGVSATSPPAEPGQTTLVVSAAPDAPIGDVLVDLVALAGDVVVGSTTVDLAVSNVDGSLDPTFGQAGVMLGVDAQTPLFGIAPLPDGKWMIGGYRGVAGQVVLARLLPDGSLDPTFGASGVLATQVEGRVPFISNMVADGAGHVAVHAEHVDAQNSVRDDIALFDVDGNVTTVAEFVAMSLASDGAGAISGVSWNGGVSHRDASGTITNAYDAVNYPSVSVRGDTTIIAGTASSQVRVAKLTVAGSALVQDTTFASTGFPVAVHYLPSSTAVASDETGRVLVGMATDEQLSVGALTPSGAIDTSFGSGGIAPVVARAAKNVVAVAPLSSDALVVGTVTDSNGAASVALARVSSSGAPVGSFGTFGRTLSYVGKDVVVAAALGSGRLCVVGESFVACYRIAP